MEGGYLPWKTQEMKHKINNYDGLARPLPSPPLGYYWEKQDDNSWYLKKFHNDTGIHDINDDDSIFVEFQKMVEIEHVILSSDTLPGICLRYNVKATTLRKFNVFSGNNIHSLQILRIPLEAGVRVQVQKPTKDIILQKFQNESGEGKIESKIYLEDANWDLQKALSLWKGDEIFHISNQVEVASFSFTGEDEVEIRDSAIAPIAIAEVIEVIPHAIQYDEPTFELVNINSSPERQPLLFPL